MKKSIEERRAVQVTKAVIALYAEAVHEDLGELAEDLNAIATRELNMTGKPDEVAR